MSAFEIIALDDGDLQRSNVETWDNVCHVVEIDSSQMFKVLYNNTFNDYYTILTVNGPILAKLQFPLKVVHEQS